MAMRRIDTEEGMSLLNLGISAELFSSTRLNRKEFQKLTSQSALEVLEALSAHGQINESFELLVQLLRQNEVKFNDLLRQPAEEFDDPSFLPRVVESLNDSSSGSSSEVDSTDDAFWDPPYPENTTSKHVDRGDFDWHKNKYRDDSDY